MVARSRSCGGQLDPSNFLWQGFVEGPRSRGLLMGPEPGRSRCLEQTCGEIALALLPFNILPDHLDPHKVKKWLGIWMVER